MSPRPAQEDPGKSARANGLDHLQVVQFERSHQDLVKFVFDEAGGIGMNGGLVHRALFG